MKEDTKKNFEELVNEKIHTAKNGSHTAFEEAVEGMETLEMVSSNENEKKHFRWDTIGKLVVVPVLGLASQLILARFVMGFEKEDTFTSSPGRGIASWFRR